MASPIRGYIVTALAFATIALAASAVEAQSQQYPPPHPHVAKNMSVTSAHALTPAEVASNESNASGDIFVRRSGRNYYDGTWTSAESEHRYVTDTRTPFYPLGPAFTANRGFDNLPSAREPFWPGF